MIVKKPQNASDDLLTIFATLIRSVLEYTVWHTNLATFLPQPTTWTLAEDKIVLRIIFPNLSYGEIEKQRSVS